MTTLREVIEETRHRLNVQTIDRCGDCSRLADAAPRLPNGRKRMVLCSVHRTDEAQFEHADGSPCDIQSATAKEQVRMSTSVGCRDADVAAEGE